MNLVDILMIFPLKNENLDPSKNSGSGAGAFSGQDNSERSYYYPMTAKSQTGL
jgi:hypothetical protein